MFCQTGTAVCMSDARTLVYRTGRGPQTHQAAHSPTRVAQSWLVDCFLGVYWEGVTPQTLNKEKGAPNILLASASPVFPSLANVP